MRSPASTQKLPPRYELRAKKQAEPSAKSGSSMTGGSGGGIGSPLPGIWTPNWKVLPLGPVMPNSTVPPGCELPSEMKRRAT